MIGTELPRRKVAVVGLGKSHGFHSLSPAELGKRPLSRIIEP
jgi:hypothetical protein